MITIAAVIRLLLGERTGKLGWRASCLRLLSLPLFDYRRRRRRITTDGGSCWRLAIWWPGALQAYFIKLANARWSAASIFFYMMLSGLLFIPVALAMTDFSQPINLGMAGPWLAADPDVERGRRADCSCTPSATARRSSFRRW